MTVIQCEQLRQNWASNLLICNFNICLFGFFWRLGPDSSVVSEEKKDAMFNSRYWAQNMDININDYTIE